MLLVEQTEINIYKSEFRQLLMISTKKGIYRISIIGIYLNGACESKGKQRVSNKCRNVGILALERFANFQYNLSFFQRVFKEVKNTRGCVDLRTFTFYILPPVYRGFAQFLHGLFGRQSGLYDFEPIVLPTHTRFPAFREGCARTTGPSSGPISALNGSLSCPACKTSFLLFGLRTPSPSRTEISHGRVVRHGLAATIYEPAVRATS